MANTVHPSTIVGKHVKLGDGNEIGPNCVLADGAVLGSRNRLWMNVYIGPGTTLGDDNQVHMGAVVGHLPQDVSYAGGETFTRIGSRNTIREYVTIHRGAKPGTETVVGDGNFLMANAHIAHNCRIGSKTILANLATLAGHCTVDDGAVLSGMVVVHQFVRIGRLAMVSGLSAVVKDVPPFMLCAGRRAVIHGLNVVGLRRAGIAANARAQIKRAYQLLYRDGLNVSNALEAIARECRGEEIAALLAFVKASKRGIIAGIGAGAEAGESEEESPLPKKPVQAHKSASKRGRQKSV